MLKCIEKNCFSVVVGESDTFCECHDGWTARCIANECRHNVSRNSELYIPCGMKGSNHKKHLKLMKQIGDSCVAQNWDKTWIWNPNDASFWSTPNDNTRDTVPVKVAGGFGTDAKVYINATEPVGSDVVGGCSTH